MTTGKNAQSVWAQGKWRNQTMLNSCVYCDTDLEGMDFTSIAAHKRRCANLKRIYSPVKKKELDQAKAKMQAKLGCFLIGEDPVSPRISNAYKASEQTVQNESGSLRITITDQKKILDVIDTLLFKLEEVLQPQVETKVEGFKIERFINENK
jgi:hypothetical protein